MQNQRTLHSLIMAGCAAMLVAAAAARVETKTSQKGMTYSIRIPDSYVPAEGGLLVVGLHGRGGNHRQFISALTGASYLSDAILVAADAQQNAEWGAEDLPVLAALLKEVGDSYNVNRTIMYGFSMGAYCSFSFSCRYPQLVQGVVPHSGGMISAPGNEDGLSEVAFYVIHGDADMVVPVAQSRSAVKRLEDAGVAHIEYEELEGLAHTMSAEASRRAFEWIEMTLGPPVARIDNATASKLIKDANAAVKAEDWPAALTAIEPLGGASRGFAKKIASLAKKCIKAPDEALALCAIEICGRLGEMGLGPLKAVSEDDPIRGAAAVEALMRTRSPKALKPLAGYLGGDSEPVACAAASALASFGGNAATTILVKGLRAVEKLEEETERKEAIHEALQRMHGTSQESAKAWIRWLARKKS